MSSLTKHPLYRLFAGIKDRCYNKNHANYKDYGGRGVIVCDEWLLPHGEGFKNFLKDVGERPSPQHSIDRKDVDEGYTPSNCRWATSKEQGRNKRNNILIEFDGKTRTLSEWSEVTGISYNTLHSRHLKGFPTERLLSKKKERISGSNTFLVKFPCGKEEEVHNLTTFCQEHGLSVGCMQNILSKNMRQKSHKGFSVKST